VSTIHGASKKFGIETEDPGYRFSPAKVAEIRKALASQKSLI